MEAAAQTGSAAATRGGGSSLPIAASRKEWRVVSEYNPHHHPDHSVRNAGDEEMDRSKMGRLDERTIYEHGRELVDVDFCSINVDGSLDNDMVQQRIQAISRQRQELLLLEIELRAQMIARAEIMEMQNRFDAQMKDHADVAGKLQEQLFAKERAVDDLERRMEEKERELRAIKLDNEAAWAKEDLLREQNKELATFRRERDHTEAERGQHIQQIRDLQEHLQEKERQILELQEQHRTTQETIFLKDEQLKAWFSRAQEVDALQSTTNHSLQAELRERTEQYNQLWLGCQRQFVEMERLHLHTIQQLQLELADARERSGTYSEDACVPRTNKKDVPIFVHNNGHPQDLNRTSASTANNGTILNILADNSSVAPADIAPSQANHVAAVPIPPSSLIGMPTYLPPGQVTAMHPFILHQQGMSQSHVGNYHSMPMSSVPQWQNQQGESENAQFSTQNQLEASQTDENITRSDGKYEYEIAANGHAFNANYTNVHVNHGPEPDPVAASSVDEQEGIESVAQSSLAAHSVDHRMQQISSQFTACLNLNSLQQNSETKDQNILNLSNERADNQGLAEEDMSTASASLSETSIHSANLNDTSINNGVDKVVTETFVTSGQPGKVTATKSAEISFLDERALLASIVRTIPSGGRIRINSTLPNRLGKMLAPLHWHDYKKKYGKLDDFVASYPELFLIEGEYIQLREGAQAKIAATAAVAKVAAAAAASAPYSSFLPSVAVTPMAQSHRDNKVSSANSGHPNVLSFGATRRTSNIKILSKSKESQQGRTTGGALASS